MYAISEIHVFDRACVWPIFKVPTDCGVAAARRTRATRRWNWRKSSTQITTWRGGGGSKWPTPYAWQSARSKFGSKTDAWSSRKRSRPSRSSTSKTKPRIPKVESAPIRPTHLPRPTEEIENKQMTRKCKQLNQIISLLPPPLTPTIFFFDFPSIFSFPFYKEQIMFFFSLQIFSSCPTIPIPAYLTQVCHTTKASFCFVLVSFDSNIIRRSASSNLLKVSLVRNCLIFLSRSIHYRV